MSPTALDLIPELDRLDAWSFWVAPGEAFGTDLVIVGTTGGFAVLRNDAVGYLKISAGRLRVGDETVATLRSMRSKAKRVRSKLSSLSIPGEVVPVLCLPGATIGAPRDVKGVWVCRPGDLVRLVAHRPNIVQRQTAKRAAQELGAKIRSVRPEGRDGRDG